MFIGVYINMTNKDALLTVAMLSAFLSKAKKDYLDLISPFVLSSLPKSENKKIDIFKFMNNSLQSIKILYNKVRNIK